jgi:hypothetical protein
VPGPLSDHVTDGASDGGPAVMVIGAEIGCVPDDVSVKVDPGSLPQAHSKVPTTDAAASCRISIELSEESADGLKKPAPERKGRSPPTRAHHVSHEAKRGSTLHRRGQDVKGFFISSPSGVGKGW